MVVNEYFFLKEFLIITLAAFFYSKHQSYTLKFFLYLAIDASLLYEILIFKIILCNTRKDYSWTLLKSCKKERLPTKIKIKSENSISRNKTKIDYRSNQLIDLRRLTHWNACEVKSKADTRLQVHSSGDLGRISTCEISPAEKGREKIPQN